MGFIRFLRNSKDTFEVQKILKAFVDAQWLNEFDLRLKEYFMMRSTIETAEETSSDE